MQPSPARLIGYISPEDHRALAVQDPYSPQTKETIRRLGSRGIEGEFAVIATIDRLSQRSVHGYMRLGPDQFGDFVSHDNLEKFDLPAYGEASKEMARQQAERMQAAKAIGDIAAMLQEISPLPID